MRKDAKKADDGTEEIKLEAELLKEEGAADVSHDECMHRCVICIKMHSIT